MPSRVTRHVSHTLRHAAAALVLSGAVAASPASAAVTSSYLYSLSDFNGTIPYNWVAVSPDPTAREVYVYNGSDSSIRVFNEMGMQTFSFNEGGELGAVRDIAASGKGELLALTTTSGGYRIKVCDYRGNLLREMGPAGIPAEFAGRFSPDIILSRNGVIYLTDRAAMRVVSLTAEGAFLKSWDIGPLLKIPAKKLQDASIGGFHVDAAGNFYFTINVFFSAYRMTPEGNVAGFGTRGSSPGKFNVVNGIATDDSGHIFIVDTLRCVVMVFDEQFTFLTEFGYRGDDPGNLVAPMDIFVQHDLLFVTQTRNRGVSVFRIDDMERRLTKGGGGSQPS